MNLVKLITDQLSDETLRKLGPLLGTDSDTASAAATAAVPTLLSSLAEMASRGESAKKLAAVLNGIDIGSMSNLAQLLNGDTSALRERGTGLLAALFGDDLISGAASAISRFSGISVEAAKSLLAYLVPMILGNVAAQWRSQGSTVGALTGLFADQKRQFADAIPAGLSLAEIPRLAGAGEAVRAAAQSSRRMAETTAAASGAAASWMLPVAVLLVGGFLLWNFLKPRPADNAPVAAQAETDAPATTVLKPVVPDEETAPPDMAAMPDAARLSDEVKRISTTFADELAAIKDPAAADMAMPKLAELKTELDAVHTTWARLPEISQPMIRQLVGPQLEPLQQKSREVAAIPGISDRVKSLVNEILQKLTELATQPTPTTPATTQ